MPAPATLVPFDVADTLSVSSALFERIVAATNCTAMKNKWFLAGDKRDIIREIADAGERAAKEFARDFAPPGFVPERVIRYVLTLPSRSSASGGPSPHPLVARTQEIEFRVHINGVAYERLVAAICSQTGF
jgi:hypothetical protein